MTKRRRHFIEDSSRCALVMHQSRSITRGRSNPGDYGAVVFSSYPENFLLGRDDRTSLPSTQGNKLGNRWLFNRVLNRGKCSQVSRSSSAYGSHGTDWTYTGQKRPFSELKTHYLRRAARLLRLLRVIWERELASSWEENKPNSGKNGHCGPGNGRSGKYLPQQSIAHRKCAAKRPYV